MLALICTFPLASIPLVWLAISPTPQDKVDNDTVQELHLSLTTLLSHREPVDIHIIARENDFARLHFDVPTPSTFKLHPTPVDYITKTFHRAQVTGGAHHSGIGGASKLLLPGILNMSTFAFFDTDTIFLRPVSLLTQVLKNMSNYHILAASQIKGLGLKQRINSGVMIFKNVDPYRWADAVVGALLINPLNCDPFHWGPYFRPICIKKGHKVGGDQEVFSVVVSASSSLYPLPNHMHSHMQGSIEDVEGSLVILHYKRRNDAVTLTQERLGINLSRFYK